MHYIEIFNPIALGPGDEIKRGKYLAEDVFAGQMMVMAKGGVMRPLAEKRVPHFGGGEILMATREHSENGIPCQAFNHTCTSILFGRTGGLGDLTLLTPVLREIKRRWPSVKIAVASIRELQQSIQNLPFIDELLAYPVTVEKAEQYDGWVWLENAIENNPDAATLHSVDAVAKFIGLELPEDCDKKQAYVVTEKERQWAQWAYPRIGGTRRLCVQVCASARCRTYPQKKMQEVVGAMLEKGWEVFLLGAPGEIKADATRPGLRVVSDGANFRQRAALIETADCVLAPDSSLTHIAGALDVPCVALYGPFPWQVRTKYNLRTKALTRKEGFSCAPCFFHAHLREQFPSHCPTKDKGVCGVLDAIPPEQVIKTIEEIAKPLPSDDNVLEFKP
jgi:ADP-heptose:LPS heptosyltransferase